MLLDSHHHTDFLPGASRAAFASRAAARDVRVVAQTLTPSSFVGLVEHGWAPGVPEPLWSLGLHPWQLASDEFTDAELAVFAEALGRTRFIGEVGLDFGPRRQAHSPAERQVRALRQVLSLVDAAATSITEPHVVSLHAVRSTTQVLDLLSEVGGCGTRLVPVLHRFQGTSQELTRLVELGGCLSVHPSLLGTKKGRAYVQQVPADRLLLESDLPEAPVVPGDDVEALAAHAADELARSLRSTSVALTQLRGDGFTAELERTQRRLYGVD